jgi:signal transduction histidine kinase
MTEKQPHIWQARAAVELVHDLANPLTVMIGYATLLVQETKHFNPASPEPVEKIRNYADVVSRAAEYCHHLADNWKRTSRNATEFTALDLVKLARDVKEVIFFNNSAIQMSGLASAYVQGSGFELTRVFQNIFKNALEAGATRVMVTFARNGENYEIAIADNGSGMDEETAKRALKGGFSTKSHGTGLGLGICRHLLGVHGATLTLESEPERGTMLRMDFPVTTAR